MYIHLNNKTYNNNYITYSGLVDESLVVISPFLELTLCIDIRLMTK
jgi:hypothetical protein